MSYESTLVFFGVRFDVDEKDAESIENRTHPLVVQGRQAGLQIFHDNFGDEGSRYFCFIGRMVAWIGQEEEAERSLDESELNAITSSITERLRAAGFTEPPRLYIQWLPPTG